MWSVALDFAVVLVMVLTATAGCGGSDGDRYNAAMSLMLDKSTAAEGMLLLQEFVADHPDDPRMPDALLSLATGSQSFGRTDEAVTYYRRLIDGHGGTQAAYKAAFLLGYLHYDTLEDLETARTELEGFVAAYPDSELAVSARVLLENLGRPVDEWGVVRKLSAQGQ